MNDEVLSFAKSIGAKDLKDFLIKSEYKGLFKRRNYFLIENNTYLIVKVSRNNISPFFGLGKVFVDIFNMLTQQTGNYYFVGLTTENSGWVLSKSKINNLISNNLLSISSDGKQYKINYANLKDNDSFMSINSFYKLIKK